MAMPNVDLDLAGYMLEANNKRYPIEAGHLRTTYHDNKNVSWDWQIALELKISDAIPKNKRLSLLYPDDASVFVYVEVLERRKEGNLTLLKLVPYF